MAVDTPPKLRRKSRLAFDIETTTGTAISLSASNAVTPIYNAQMPYNTEMQDRQTEGSISPIRQGRGARSGTVSFETDLFGNAASGLPDYVKLFRACGLSLTGSTLTPVSGATETLTIGHYIDGILKKLVGCMGSFVITMRRGEAARVAWTFTGVQDQPSDTSILAPTQVTTIPPRVGGTITVGAATYRMPDVVFNCGNNVILREDVTAVDSAGEPTGYRAAYITSRSPSVIIAPELVPLATKDWYDVFRDSATVALSAAIGAVANNTITLAAPKMELIADPTEGDRNGLLVSGLTFSCLRNSDAGNDEYTVTYS